MTYKAVCKCRLCGEEFECGAVTGNEYLAFNSIIEMSLQRYTILQAPHLIEIHSCKNGNIGCADFIGWKIDT